MLGLIAIFMSSFAMCLCIISAIRTKCYRSMNISIALLNLFLIIWNISIAMK